MLLTDTLNCLEHSKIQLVKYGYIVLSQKK